MPTWAWIMLAVVAALALGVGGFGWWVIHKLAQL